MCDGISFFYAIPVPLITPKYLSPRGGQRLVFRQWGPGSDQVLDTKAVQCFSLKVPMRNNPCRYSWRLEILRGSILASACSPLPISAVLNQTSTLITIFPTTLLQKKGADKAQGLCQRLHNDHTSPTYQPTRAKLPPRMPNTRASANIAFLDRMRGFWSLFLS